MAGPGRDTVMLDELCWPDVRGALARGVDTIVIVTGSTEQHGPQLPLMTDHQLGRGPGERVARRLPNALMAPVVSVGCSEHHMAFPGSMTLSTPTFVAVVAEYCLSLAGHGFRKVLLLSSHGGNFRPLDEVLARVRAERPDLTVIAYNDLGRFVEVMFAQADRLGIAHSAAG